MQFSILIYNQWCYSYQPWFFQPKCLEVSAPREFHQTSIAFQILHSLQHKRQSHDWFDVAWVVNLSQNCRHHSCSKLLLVYRLLIQEVQQLGFLVSHTDQSLQHKTVVIKTILLKGILKYHLQQEAWNLMEYLSLLLERCHKTGHSFWYLWKNTFPN